MLLSHSKYFIPLEREPDINRYFEICKANLKVNFIADGSFSATYKGNYSYKDNFTVGPSLKPPHKNNYANQIRLNVTLFNSFNKTLESCDIA